MSKEETSLLREAGADIGAELLELRSQLAEIARHLARRDSDLDANAAELLLLRSQLADVSLALAKREAELDGKDARLNDAINSVAQLRKDFGSERKSRDALQASLDRALRQAEAARSEAKALEGELRQVRSSPIWKIAQALYAVARAGTRLLPALRRRIAGKDERIAREIAASDLFDAEWYRKQYPDVASESIDPALHYVRFGVAEGRDPGPKFSTRWYLETYKDVATSGSNPLLHYLRHGKTEDREIAPSKGAPVEPSMPTESPAVAAEPFSLPSPPAVAVAWPAQEIVRGEDRIALELAGQILATVAESNRAALAEPARVLAAYCRLLGLGPEQGIAPAGDTMWHEAIADVWYVNDRGLRFRFEGRNLLQASVARFFQYDLASGALVLTGESPLAGGGLEFADAALRNAFAPVLIVLTAPDGELISASLLPFPSLCRGGVHYAELCFLDGHAGYVDSLRAASDQLLQDALGDRTDFSIARIEVDLQGALGSERIFASELREWLAAVMSVAVRPANSAAVANPKVRSYLEASLGPVAVVREDAAACIAAREESGTVTLTITADGVPTLQALLARDLPAGGVGSFFVSEDATAAPRWRVAVPALGNDLIDLQPAATPVVYPLLTALTARSGVAPTEGSALPPLTIHFGDTRPRQAASLVMPVAPDVPGSLLRRGAAPLGGDSPAISVLFAGAMSENKDRFAALLQSLRLQTVADAVEIVAVSDAAHRPAVERALLRSFPDRHRILEQPEETNRSARINAAAEIARGRLLLVVAAEAVLHDSRTLETLCTLADDGKVASAGCMLLHTGLTKASQTVVFRSAGIFADGAESAFWDGDCLGAFPLATYPVAANPALFMVRADIWRSVGGFDAARFPDTNSEVDYGIRTIAKGLRHYCTSAVSAELLDREFPTAKAWSEPLAADAGAAFSAAAATIRALRP